MFHKKIWKSSTPARLFTWFTILSLLSLAAILFLVHIGIGKILVKAHIGEAEYDAISISRLLLEQERDTLMTHDSGGDKTLSVLQEDLPGLDRRMRRFLSILDLVKIKIISKDREIIYSTDSTIIGQIDRYNENLERSLKGEVISKLEKNDKVWDLSGERRHDGDIVETYLPVRNENNEIVGSFEIYFDITRYENNIKEYLVKYTAVIAAILVLVFGVLYVLMRYRTNELSEVQKKLEDLAVTDELTGIYNRRGFFTLSEQQLKLASREKRGRDILSVDLDNLKRINDQWGHMEGDLVLRATANILKESFRESDIIARIGGDEFVVMAVQTTENSNASLISRLKEKVDAYNMKANKPYNLSLSLGITGYDPEQPQSIDELITEADKMMYECKTERKK